MEFPTIATYERHLVKCIIPRWGNLAPLAIQSTEVEKWFLELRRGNPQRKVTPFADPTVDKVRHHASGLQARAAARVSAAPARRDGNPLPAFKVGDCRRCHPGSLSQLLLIPPEKCASRPALGLR